MPNNTSGFGKVRTMAEDMRKAERPSEEKTSERLRLEKIMDGADGGAQDILKDLKSPSLHKEKRSSSLDVLLPIEKTPPRTEAATIKPKIPSIPIEKSAGGRPPTNLPGVPKVSETRIEDIAPKPQPTPIKPKVPEVPIVEVSEEPKVVLPKSDLAAKPTGEEDLDGKPKETPEELLTLSLKETSRDELPPKETAPRETKPKSKPFKFAAILGVIFLVAGLLGFSYWNFFIKEGDTEQVIPPPTQSTNLIAPLPLFPANFEVIIRAKEQVRNFEFSSPTLESITYIALYLEDKEKFPNPEELFTALDIQAPAPLFRLLNDAATLYVYAPGIAEKEACEQKGASGVDCHSSRLGVVFHMSLENVPLINGVMKDWENTLAQDARPFVFGTPSLPSGEFQSAEYRNIPIKYIHLPTSDTAVNYAIVDQFVIIATSKNSLYKVMDTIIEME